MTTKAAILLRASTHRQQTENQLPNLEQFWAARGLEIVRRFEVSESAWNGGKMGGGAMPW